MLWLLCAGVLVVGGGITTVAGAWLAARGARARLAAVRIEAHAVARSAELEAAAARREAETEGREEALELRAAAEQQIAALAENLARRGERVSQREGALQGDAGELETRWAAAEERGKQAQADRDRAAEAEQQAAAAWGMVRDRLEALAGETGTQVRDAMAQQWLEEARARAAQLLRSVEQSSADPEHGRSARRVMEIATARYQTHFLTERNLSNIAVAPEIHAMLLADGERIERAIETVANVQLLPNETGDAVRLDGLDGVGREIARRALAKLAKRHPGEVLADPEAFVREIKEQLDREIVGLGRKAFTVLDIPRAHPEIVQLVGKLNYRTSYTQNQWLHAVEASFLAGMMASELGLDLKLARRATLMHDIGKALTHEIDGSHAVIGADIARRLGEPEVVANAIGAHHADEPPGSVYAFLVAAADAMSGARPGARREQTEQYSTRLEDLERIGASHRGVERAHAVHGGRELRVYVRDRDIGDAQVVELSSRIAAEVSDKLVFPGQIKVTVIRAFEAVSTAN